jgi:adenine-specific DNA-methyltransferase
MSSLDSLIARVGDDPLRAELAAAFSDLRKTRDFGLVFERHRPETVRLPHHALRRAVKVALREDHDRSIFRITRLSKGEATIRRIRHPDGSALDHDEQPETRNVSSSQLVVVAEFGDPIYPGLKHLGSIHQGGNRPAHIVVNGENHHVLEALQFTHAHKVDCIYIDPPYNGRNRDWKYNNDYVDTDDDYRHSKWLAFMERRLKLAKQLLNPEDSVLIVSIDEKEYLRLGLLLEQMFADCRVQMVSSLINPAAVARPGAFGRSDEYLFFVMVGRAAPQRLRLPREWVSDKGRTHTGNIRWDLLRRSGPGAARSDSPGCFYPIYVDPDGPTIAHIGDTLPPGVSEPEPMDGYVPVLPIRKDGSEGRWQWKPRTIRSRMEQGRVRVSGSATKGYTVYVLKDGEYEKIVRGEFDVTGGRPDGSLVVGDVETEEVLAVPSSQWRISSHDATQYGSRMLSSLIPGRHFDFPKSLYAVEDAIRFFVSDKPDAVVLDYFGGSGTTTHAVARLNRQDGGRRQSILVTNNELSEAEAEDRREQGWSPGDPEWEALGIFEHVTRPRIVAAVTGMTPDGHPIQGQYSFSDDFPMAEGFEENIEFFELTYEDAARVEVHMAFPAIAPLLWLRAGGEGSIINECLESAGERTAYAWADRYGVLFNTDRWRGFIEKLPDTATTVFIVTDSPTTFSHIVAELPTQVEAVRLYERYLTTFAINGGSGGLS